MKSINNGDTFSSFCSTVYDLKTWLSISEKPEITHLLVFYRCVTFSFIHKCLNVVIISCITMYYKDAKEKGLKVTSQVLRCC